MVASCLRCSSPDTLFHGKASRLSMTQHWVSGWKMDGWVDGSFSKLHRCVGGSFRPGTPQGSPGCSTRDLHVHARGRLVTPLIIVMQVDF